MQLKRKLTEKHGKLSESVTAHPPLMERMRVKEDLTWMSSDVKWPIMSLVFFLGGGGAGLWAGGRSVLLGEGKDNMTLSTVRAFQFPRPLPSTPPYNEKSCLHLPFRISIDGHPVCGFVAVAAISPAL